MKPSAHSLCLLMCWLAVALAPVSSAQDYGEEFLPAGTAPGDEVGRSVSLCQDTLLVGSPRNDSVATDAGAVSIFRRSGDLWWEAGVLYASDATSGAEFGCAVAVDGDTAIVGAYRDAERGVDAGAAYIFERRRGQWVQVLKFTAADGDPGDYLGQSVALQGDTAVVAAIWQDGAAGSNTGAVYVLERRDGGEWTSAAKLTAFDASAEDAFGYSLVAGDEEILVAAHRDDDVEYNSGSVYVFERVNDMWEWTSKLQAPDPSSRAEFGFSMATSENVLVVGAANDPERGTDAGALYVFERDAGAAWVFTQKLTASDGMPDDRLGWSVAAYGDWLVGGAALSDARGSRSGAAYTFKRADGVWREIRKLAALDGAQDDGFGYSVAVGRGVVLAGSHRHDHIGTDSGSVYAFLPSCPSDFKLDGQVNTLDVLAFLNAWTTGCP